MCERIPNKLIWMELCSSRKIYHTVITILAVNNLSHTHMPITLKKKWVMPSLSFCKLICRNMSMESNLKGLFQEISRGPLNI